MLQVPPETGLIFSSIKYSKPLSDATLSKLLRELGIPAGSGRASATGRRNAPTRRAAWPVCSIRSRCGPGTIRTDEGTSEGIQAKGPGTGLEVLFFLGGYRIRHNVTNQQKQ